MKANITIAHQSLNTDRAIALGLVFKLEFVVEGKAIPDLEVFPDNEETRALEWEIYGANNDREDLLRIVKFDEKTRTARFELDGKFEIEFTGRSEQEIIYARSGPTMEPAFHFEVKVLNPN